MNILLMYISEHSGHHQASAALAKAIREIDPDCSILSINAFKFTSPVLEKITHKAYMGVIKKRPEIWNYLYDNPSVASKTERIRRIFNDAGSRKLERLIADFKPDAVACTQALPCSIMAYYKKRRSARIPLVGILTDYAPHSYWINEGVDKYVVPSEKIKDSLVRKGVPPEKIEPSGTPIDPAFATSTDTKHILRETGFSGDKPIILIMGGTHGIGPDEKLVKALDTCREDIQMIIVTGVNKRLFRRIKKIEGSLKKKVVTMGFVDNVHELMQISELIVTKPGGMTTAESLAKSLPMVIINPLPGQEDLNTKTLTDKGMALKAADENDAAAIIDDLLRNPEKMEKMRDAMRKNAKPQSASEAARLLAELAG